MFDLFGTLVPPFAKRAHRAALAECAAVLQIAPELCDAGWRGSYRARIAGEFLSVADNFDWICRQGGQPRSADACRQAESAHAVFTRRALSPLPGVRASLSRLRDAGARIGLLTNCAPDVPLLFAGSDLASCFDATVFSCQAGVVKPDRGSYEAVLQRLGASPSAAIFVGDGSDSELTGASAVGMTAVLVTPCLEDTYDSQRHDVTSWSGLRFPDVCQVVDALLQPAP
ncbi:MAG TPA: HAD-IA family hydrolase [Acidimicrobiales bacterium]|nr:HAD-IA family hydrolase [Acidimicrobiales bacterium]